MMKDFWNQRYAEQKYAYGETPNVFFQEQLVSRQPGKLLLPAEGEGRNAVYAATLGWEVEAFDQSESGQAKALQLADRYGVKINYQVLTLEVVEFPENHFDAIGLIYTHFPAEKRKNYHQKLISFLKPGGYLFLEGFNQAQINYQSGGPRDSAMLFSPEVLLEDFSGMQIELLQEREVVLQEGLYHVGPAAVIRLVASKF
jgi:cyclopropane fatty-acyl-phospholipid synthase-like methyltransferase